MTTTLRGKQSMKYGYARIAPEYKDELEQQTQMLKEHGAECIYEDISRIKKGKERPVFTELTNKLKTGDTLIVSSLDRLANNFGRIYEIIKNLDDMGVVIISISEDVNTGTKQGRVFMKTFKNMSSLYIKIISENTETGKLEAVKAGINIHRTKSWTDEQALNVLDCQVNKNYSIEELSNKFGFSHATIGRMLKRARELKSQSNKK